MKRLSALEAPDLATAQQLELLNALMHGTTDAVYTKDLEGRYLSINPAGAQALGRTVDEVIGRTDFELFPEATARATRAHDRQVLTAGTTLAYEDVHGPPGATRVWLTTKGVLRDGRGEVLGLFGISREITERKRMEQALQANEERLRLCIEAAQLATWDWDLRAGTLSWSANGPDIVGLPMAVLLEGPRAFLRSVHREDRVILERAIARALEAPGDQAVEFRVVPPNGEPRWLKGMGRVLWWDGKPVRALGVAMDISPQKVAEEELRRAALIQSQLIGIVSHDIRSPVGAILGWAHMLLDQDSIDVVESADRIINSARRVERLTQQMLDLTEARLGQGIPVDPRPMDLHELVERMMDEVRASHPDRPLEVELSGDGNGTWDVDRLSQVVANLLQNAIKYSPAGSPVRLTAREVKGAVELSVHNGGDPIPPELLRHVFEPFRKGAHKAKGVRSLGLGLYIVRELVSAHGGTVGVTSSQAEGTTFTVRLPKPEKTQVG